MAQHDTPAHSGKTISLLRVDAYEHGGIVVTSTAIDAEGWLDPVHSAAGMGPPRRWNGAASWRRRAMC